MVSKGNGSNITYICAILDNAADSKDAEKAELKEVPSHADDMPKTETKTAPEEKEDLIKEK